MKIEELYQDYNVDYLTEGHRHCRPGWANTSCPFCSGNPGYHLSFNMKHNYFICWRCGWHNNIQTISALLGVRFSDAQDIIKEYGGKSNKADLIILKKAGGKPHQLPSNSMPLLTNHKKYLEKRNFNPNKLEKKWGILGTGPLSMLDDINFKHRIVIPIIWDGQQVSFQTRAISNSNLKYITCPKDREIIEHKHILYGKQEAWGDVGICVEGVTDVWRFGSISFSTFGISYTTQQVRQIKNNFKKVIVIFDSDPQAQVQANKLVNELVFKGVNAFNIKIDGDPAEMNQKNANKLIKKVVRL